jgi:hypothetical protein
VADGGFEVTASDLDDGADEFKTKGEGILDAQKLYESEATLPESAFGNLPQSKQIYAQYQKFFSQVSGDQTKLAEALLEGTFKLALSAALYRAADELAAERSKQIG